MQKTPRYFIWDNSLSMAAYWACSGAIISRLSEYFGLSLALSNLITGFTAILPIVQLAGGLAYGHAASPLRFLRLTSGLWRLFLPLVFFSVALPKGAGAWAMVVSYLAAVGIYQFSASPQISWVSGCVQGQAGTDYYARREMHFMAAYTGAFCLVSLTIDHTQRSGMLRGGFLGIGVFVALLMAASLAVLAKLPAPPTRPKAPAAADLWAPMADKPFRRVIWAGMAWNFSCSLAYGFSMVYQVQVLKLSFVTIMLWTTLANLTRTLFTPVMARLARPLGWKNVTALCALLMAGITLLWAGITGQNAAYLYPAAIVASAVPYAGVGVGFLNMQIDTSPAESRSVYVSVNALWNGVGALAGSVLCSALAARLEAISPTAPRYVFYVGMVCTLAAMAVIWHAPTGQENKFRR